MNSFAAYWHESFNNYRLRVLDKRHVTQEDISKILASNSKLFRTKTIGNSFEGRPIEMLSIGAGEKNVIAWSCMHGNETTALRGWMDLFVALSEPKVFSHFSDLFKEFTIHFVPMLNPDGAQRYTRRNAMDLDMNRDARALQTPEMQAITRQIELLKPALAFNLHDQRNIFAVNKEPATISFLAPSVNRERSVDESRALTMHLIGKASKGLKPYLNNGIGRYTDEYYPTAIGEFVQQKGIPAILVECGSAINDPLRQQARMANAIILHETLSSLSNMQSLDLEAYNTIPINESNQVDILIKGISVLKDGKSFKADLALLAEENVIDGQFTRLFKVHDFGDLHALVALENYHWKKTIKFKNTKIASLAELEFETDKGPLSLAAGILF